MEITALIFDLDGTLIDSAPDIAAAVNTILARAGYSKLAVADIMGFVGDGLAKTLERSLGAAAALPPSPAMLAQFEVEYAAHAADLTRPYPGVAATLAQIRDAGFRMAICTNKGTDLSRFILEALDLAANFEFVVGADRVAEKKPDPCHVLACLGMLGVTPGETAMVGDSANDVIAAHAAGCRAIYVSYGYGDKTGLPVDASIDRFDMLPETLADFRSSSPAK